MLIGAIVAVVVFTVLISLVGIGAFVRAVGDIPPPLVGLLFLTALAGIASMGSSFYAVSDSLDLGFSPLEAISMFTTINLAHNLTPFAQAGGEPVGAMILSQRSGRPYETCLAAISAFDVINFVPAVLIFVTGSLYIAVFSPQLPSELRPIIGAFGIFVLTVSLIIILIYRWPMRTRRGLERTTGGFYKLVARLWPSHLPGLHSVVSQLRGYTDSLGVVANDHRTIVTSASFATAAFTAQGIVLWLALNALEVHLSVVIAVVIIPISLVASVIPLPGGGGGVEAVQVTLIIALTRDTLGNILTAVVLSRGIVFWLPVLLGMIVLGRMRLGKD